MTFHEILCELLTLSPEQLDQEAFYYDQYGEVHTEISVHVSEEDILKREFSDRTEQYEDTDEVEVKAGNPYLS